MGETVATGAAGPALVELLPRVLHDSPAAILLVDLNRGEDRLLCHVALRLSRLQRVPEQRG